MSPICTAPQSGSNVPFTIYIYRTWLKHHTLFVQKTTKTAGNFMYSVYMLTRSSGNIRICKKSIQEIIFYLIRREWDFWQKLPWAAPCFQFHRPRNIHMAKWVWLSNFDRILQKTYLIHQTIAKGDWKVALVLWGRALWAASKGQQVFCWPSMF